jgi:ribosome-associated translation inhibitor RaiA
MNYNLEQYRLKVSLDSKECEIPEQTRMQLQDWLVDFGKWLESFPSSDLAINVVYHPNTDIYHAEAKLKVPGQTITTGDYEKSIEEAIKRCLDKATRRVEAYLMDPNREALEQAELRAERNEAVVGSQEPNLDRLGEAVKAQDYRAFRNAIQLDDEFVRLRVGRWVQRYPEIEQEIGRTILISDLVEEVFLMAFEKYNERPPHMNLHDWLDALIDPAVKAYYHDPDERLAVSYAQSLTGS